MWKLVAPAVLFVVMSMCSGNPEPGRVYLQDYTLGDGHNDICSCNEDGSKSCTAEPHQKVDFLSTWVVEGCDCSDLWISLIWRNIHNNASTRSYACPVACYNNNLVIHGDCDTREVLQGVHILEPFRFTIPDSEGVMILDVLYDADFKNGAKTRDCYVGTFYVNC